MLWRFRSAQANESHVQPTKNRQEASKESEYFLSSHRRGDIEHQLWITNHKQRDFKLGATLSGSISYQALSHHRTRLFVLKTSKSKMTLNTKRTRMLPWIIPITFYFCFSLGIQSVRKTKAQRSGAIHGAVTTKAAEWSKAPLGVRYESLWSRTRDASSSWQISCTIHRGQTLTRAKTAWDNRWRVGAWVDSTPSRFSLDCWCVRAIQP